MIWKGCDTPGDRLVTRPPPGGPRRQGRDERRVDRLARERREPTYVRFDNGPEFIAYAVADWCRFNGTGTLFIDPGSPWQNGFCEPFNSRLRDEILNQQVFDTLFEAKILLEDHRIDYNFNRAHSSRLDHPCRVRRAVAHPTTAVTRTVSGPGIGDRSIRSPRSRR